jgi:hypothetical protein
MHDFATAMRTALALITSLDAGLRELMISSLAIGVWPVS